MTNGKETLLGATKYDGKIRRITLLKTVADKLNMRDGDEIEYYFNGEDIIIRKGRQQELDLSALFRTMPEDRLRVITGQFCSTNDISGYGKDIDWSKVPKNKLEDEFMRATDSMSREERLRLANKLLIELANGKG